MTEERPRRGRPKKEGDQKVSFHLGLRFDAGTEAKLREIVAAANERAVSVGLPANQTIYSLVRAAITEWIAKEHGKLTRKKR